MPDLIDGNNCIGNGLPASVMRQSMENKNALSAKGSIYVGTGSNISVEIAGDTYNIATTSVLSPNGASDDGKIIRYNSSAENGLEIINPADSSVGFHSYFADNVNLSAAIEQNDVTNALDVEINCGIGEIGTFAIPLATGNGLGVIKLTNDISCVADDATVSANVISNIVNVLNDEISSNISNVSQDINNVSSNLNSKFNSFYVQIGNNSLANSSYAISIGANSCGVGSNDISIGHNANANTSSYPDASGISIGLNSFAEVGISVGENAFSDNLGVAIGYYSVAREPEPALVAVGAVSVGTLSNSANTSISVGYNANSNDWSIAIGESAISSNQSISIGGSATSADKSIDIGGQCLRSNQSISIGGYVTSSNPISTTTLATAIGRSAFCNKSESVAIGAGATCYGQHSGAFGFNALASNNNEIVLGDYTITALRCQVQTISALSDSRVKEDVELANTAICLADVNRLPVSRFKYKKFTGTHLDEHRTGFMADDVEKVFPKDIILRDEVFPELDEDGNEIFEDVIQEDGTVIQKRKEFTLEKVKSISMAMGLPTLWGAVQELTKRLEALEQENQQLKERINSL